MNVIIRETQRKIKQNTSVSWVSIPAEFNFKYQRPKTGKVKYDQSITEVNITEHRFPKSTQFRVPQINALPVSPN